MFNRSSIFSGNYLQKITPYISYIVLSVLLAVVFFSVIATLLQEKSDALLPKATNGEMNLIDVDFDSSYTVPLEGEWKLYWQALLNPEENPPLINDASPREQTTSEIVNVPHVWLDMPLVNDKKRTKGYATYKLDVRVAKNIKNLAIRIPAIGSAFRMYIDDNLIAVGGQVGNTEEAANAGYHLDIVEFSLDDSSFEITVQVSNYDMVWGGIWSDLRIGKVDKVYLEQSVMNFKATFIIATFLTIATFNLVQFSLRTKDATPLVISVICILLAFREIESSGLLAYLGLYDLSYNTHAAINFLSFYMCAGLFLAYYALSFPQEFNRKIAYAIVIISGAYSLSVMILPPYVFTQFTTSFQLISFAMIIYILGGLLLAVVRNRESANIILFGSVVLCSLVINDILMNLRVIDSVSLVNLGLVCLIMCKNFAMYHRFVSAVEQNSHLNKELEAQNDQLEKFSRSLEDLVDNRTKALSKANEKLEVLASSDSLTDSLNRRGLLHEIAIAQEKHKENGQPFCLLLLDFDHFKRLNDTLGHKAGDTVLVEAALHIKSVISIQSKLGRWGGEEFLILLTNTRLEDAEDIAQGVRTVVHNILSAKLDMSVSVSIGVAEYDARESIEKTINRADQALYMAKSMGRNRVELAEPFDAPLI